MTALPFHSVNQDTGDRVGFIIECFRTSFPFVIRNFFVTYLPNAGLLSKALSWVLIKSHRVRFTRNMRSPRRVKRPKAGIPGSVHGLSPYVYETLPNDRYTRYFELAPGQWNEPIRGVLRMIPMDELEDYEAVSYVWGDQKSRIIIDCNGSSISVGVNLALLLRRMRLLEGTRRLWVDALCIDQSNKHERSVQVRHMGYIYEHALRGVFWLGDEDEQTAEAFSLLQELAQMVQLVDARTGYSEVAHTLTAQEMQQRRLPDLRDERWNPFWKLLLDQWFMRTWILQEACLTPHAIMQRGSFTIEWTKFVRLIAYMVSSQAVRNDFAASTLVHFCLWVDYGLDLLETLQLARGRFCTEPLDRVFSILGLAKHQPTHLSSGSFVDTSELQTVDYDEPTSELYRRVARVYLLQGDLRPLGLASNNVIGNVKGLPSWVPDWTAWNWNTPIYYSLKHLVPEGEPVRFALANRTPVLSQDGKQLTVYGALHDQVVAVGRHVRLRGISPREFGLIYLESWRCLAFKHLNLAVVRTSDVVDAFARLLVFDHSLTRFQRWTHAETYFRYLDAVRNTNHRVDGRQVLYFDDNQLDIRNFAVYVKGCVTYRTFFITASGYLGLGPFTVRVGDQIAQFDGGWTPFVLRSVGKGCHEIVGESYIQGLMKGEKDFTAVNQEIHLV
ncbi:hypothetical protein BAUCODRAFT_229334 [Baudoinia panamericana UAMH 10762]|uniref:Heterokaryon incompatibility domain-containing protein n=1 Tax=Baudoinia panamericana (strain UAMH 10762) TaxID=717646 RepID=M2N377_BAUPA|nr:uncharacterized protein BAUCODRAFT_229334 [Baudoinia panamericana UAMH 10762]EMC93150.1 hypothetical protein BAUCODRAFT_229334 [Baudoinia panamericana UAMH 10762]